MTPKILIIEARFYDELNDMLIAGAKSVLENAGAETDILTVPGALELPAALNFVAQGPKQHDAYVVLGVVIRGETGHYDIVANESARGVYDVAHRLNLVVGNGILTTEDWEQAEERADPARLNKGAGAAEAALRMLTIKRQNIMV